MRIIHCINSLKTGGAERLLLSLALEQKRYADVVVFTLGAATQLDERFRAAGLTVVNGAKRKGATIGWSTPYRFGRLLMSFQPDVVHSHLPQSDLFSLLAKPRRASHVSTLHTSGQSSANSLTARLCRKAFARLSWRSTALIATSTSAKEFAQDLGVRCPIEVVLNGSGIRPGPPAKLEGKKAVCLARLHPVKGIDVLLAAFSDFLADVPGWTLELYGRGMHTDNPAVKALVESAGARGLVESGSISFCGETKEVMSVLSGADVLVSSSKGLETMPLVWVEASLAGVPIVTTRVGEWRSVADREELTAIPGDRNSLRSALEHYSRLGASERQAIGARARRVALRDWTIEGVAEAYREVYIQGETTKRGHRGAA